MNNSLARHFGMRVEMLLRRRNFDGARRCIDEAENRYMQAKNDWDKTFDELGLAQNTTAYLNRAGLFTPRDIKRETFQSLQEIEGVSAKRATAIMQLMGSLLTPCQ